MNEALIKLRAQELRNVLQELSPVNALANSLNRPLQPLIESALNGEIQQPLTVSTIPANRTFTEGLMDDTPRLANAYGEFVAALADVNA